MRGAGSFTARLAPELRFGAAGLGRRRISRPPDASVSRGGGVWLPLAPRMLWVARCHEGGGVVAGGSCCSALFGGAGVAGARAVWRWSAAQGLRALGRFVDAGWQHSRAVHDSRGPCSEKRPFLAGYSRGVSSNGCLQGFSDAWRAYPAKASSFRMHGARILPRTGDFPVRGRFRDAWGAKLATDCRPGTHRGGILPRQDPRERTARGYCHCQSGQGRIRAQSRHRRTLGNASREHFAIVERLGTYQGIILPRPDARAERSARPCATAPARLTSVAPDASRLSMPPDIPTPLNCGCCRRFGRWRWHNPLIVALLPSGS